MSLTSYWRRRASTARCDNAATEHWLITEWTFNRSVFTGDEYACELEPDVRPDKWDAYVIDYQSSTRCSKCFAKYVAHTFYK